MNIHLTIRFDDIPEKANLTEFNDPHDNLDVLISDCVFVGVEAHINNFWDVKDFLMANKIINDTQIENAWKLL